MSASRSTGGYGDGVVDAKITAPQIPRIVWMLWFQGWDRAPYVCKNCKKSFELWNPGWEVRALDEKMLPDVLGDYCKQFTAVCKANNPLAPLGMSWIPPAAAADVLRLFLLRRYGGVWADATILCQKPLDEWIDDAAAYADGFFAFAPEKGDEIPIMSSFLASKPHHPLVEAWEERVQMHWQLETRPNLEYFWLHVLFGKLVQENHAVKELWQRRKKLTGEYGLPGPHLLMPYEQAKGFFDTSKVLAQAPTAQFKELLAKKARTGDSRRTIHDVKFDKRSNSLLQRDGSEFGIRAADSGFEYLMQKTLEEAAIHFERSKEGGSAEWQPDASPFRRDYGSSPQDVDTLLLQNLPESRRSHVCVLLIWLAVTLACCVEVWVCAGAAAGTTWLFGYLMELLYSADHVFVMQLVFSSLDTPHRLMPKAACCRAVQLSLSCVAEHVQALYIAMISSMAFRLVGFLYAPVNSRCCSWILGTGLVYAGISRLSFQRLEQCADVTESAVVRFLRCILGDRLGEFYDEEGEAILVEVKGKYRLSLLGVVLLCLFVVNFLLSFDVVLAKSEMFNDVFLNFSSSILALFAIRSLFFVVRDFFNLSSITRSTLALVLLLMGLEMLAGPTIYVSAFTSCLVFSSMLALAVGIATLQQSHAKLPLSVLH
eukprot:symbB.v1.2.028172.t4/scaffold2961.1/size66437/4